MPFIIGIGGPSCAGKTYLSSYIRDIYKDRVEVVNLDSYYKDFSYLPFEERTKLNFDCPESIDFDRIIQDVKKLKNGEEVDVPNYDFASHKPLDKVTHVYPKEIVIIEGILSLYPENLRRLFDLTVFVDAKEVVRFNRRLERDQRERGRSEESIIYQFNNVVVPMQKLYIDPLKDSADLYIENNENNGPLPMAEPLIEKLKGVIIDEL